MRIAVIGGGISGLAAARLLSVGNKVTVYERCSRPGGLVRCTRVDGHLFHLTGGHVFNTKREDVLDWFRGLFDYSREFTKADRNSVIIMPDGRHVRYPIENHAYMLDDETLRAFIADLRGMAGAPTGKVDNFGDFLLGTFGRTLYDLYFRPYNEKVWRTNLKEVPLSWLDGKLPMPSFAEILYNNFRHIEEKAFVHSTFYYPVSGGSQFVADRMAEGLDIRYNADITTLTFESGRWIVDGEEYDKVIFCGNIKELPTMARGWDIDRHAPRIEALKAHGTTTVLCEIDDNPYSWIYLPDRRHRAHRIICTGNFSPTNRADGRMSATVEFTDCIGKDEILDNLERIPLHPRYLAHNYAEYTYPIQAQDTRTLVSAVKAVTEPLGLFLLGRFAEWEYYNMDAAVGAAIDLMEVFKH